MKSAFGKIAILTIFIGVIGFSLNIIFASQNGYVPITYISEKTVNGITFYYYDFWSYIENIRNTIKGVAQLELSMPTREWMTISTDWTQIPVIMIALQNNLVLTVDYIIVGINILIYPVRLAFYVIQIILSIVGVPIMDQNGAAYQSNMAWLITLVKFGANVQLPYM